MTLTLPAAGLLPESSTEEPSINYTPLPSPRALMERVPTTGTARETVREGRAALRAILRREEDRFIVVIGPCSIHDTEAALEYAHRLQRLQSRLKDRLQIVMRVYLEKPRTTIGWRGLVNDPYLDGSYDMAEGLLRARQLLGAVNDLGLPTATEVLDLDVAAYLSDLITFAAIGARTTESQPHRALASGLGLPVGFKNGTDGALQTALDAIASAARSHSYVGIDPHGRASRIRTAGNPDGALILRGGRAVGPNWEATHVAEAEQRLRGLDSPLPPAVIVDCSHANSGYDHAQQAPVCLAVAAQRVAGTRVVRGVMLESNLQAGKQSLNGDGTDRLRYGVSVTDACIGWDETENLLLDLHRALA